MNIRIKSGEAVLLSPFDVHTYIVELPPLKDSLRENAVRFKLRSIHPEDPSYMILDIKPCGPINNGTVLVYTVNQTTLEAYRALSLPLISGISLFRAARKRIQALNGQSSQNALVFLETPEWIQTAAFVSDCIICTTALRNTTSEDTRRAMATFVRECGISNYSTVHLTLGCDGTEKLSDDPTIRLSANTVSESISMLKDQLFPVRAPIRKRLHFFMITLLTFLNLLCIFTFASRVAEAYETHAAKLKSAYEIQQKQIIHRSELQNELTLLSGSNSIKRVSPYKEISLLQKYLNGAWIHSFSLQGNSFKFEAEGVDSLKILAALQSTATLSHVRLQQALPSDLRGDIFTITGEIMP